MIEPSKNIIVLSSPETEPKWPKWPGYTPLWTVAQINEWATEISWRKEQYVYGEAFDILTAMRIQCDKALSELQFENWQLRGLLKGKRQTPPDATLKDEPVAQ